MKTVTLYAFNDKAGEFQVVGTVSLDKGKLSGDTEAARQVLREPIRSRGKDVTTDTPEEFLSGLNLHYRNEYLSASPVKGK
jgi:hypothetical protein